MKSKLYLIIFLAVASGMPMPAQAGIWSSLRNSAIITTLFGKPLETNYTAQTRLPVVEVKPSFWARMFNFYSWMNFKKSAQPEAAPAPEPVKESEPAQPILSPEAAARFNNQLDRLRNEYVQTESILSPEAAQNLADRFDAIHKEHEAKKLAELAALKEREELISAVEREQKASAQHYYDKNAAVEDHRKLQHEVEESTKVTQEQFGKREQEILKLKRELTELQVQHLKERELSRSAIQKEAREQIEALSKNHTD